MAAISLKRINRFALGEARTHKKFFIISNIVLGMGGLLYLFTSEIKSDEGMRYDGASGQYIPTEDYLIFNPSVLGLLLLVIGGAIGMICAAQIFRDMNNVQLGDVQLSLPMSASERYLSKLLALCYIHVIPLLLWSGIPSAINALRFVIVGSGKTINDTFDQYFIPLFFLAILAGTLFTEAVTILCTVCCGAFAESIYFSLISIGCLSVGPALIWYTLTQTCAGQFGEPGLIFGVWTLSFVICAESNVVTGILGILGVNCAVSVAVMFLTLLIYRRRDARSVGTPIANKVFFECMMFAGLMTVYSMFFFRAEAYIGVIVVGIIYMVIHIITSRGKLNAKQLLAWFGKFLVSTAVFVALSGAAYVTGGFGMVTHLPASNLEHANIMVSMNNANETGYTEIDYDVVGSNDISSLTDEQVRSAARVFQKYAANHKKSFADFAEMILDGYNSNYSDRDSYSAKVSIDCYVTDKDKYRNGYFDNLLDQDVFLTSSEVEALDKELQQFDFLERSVQTHKYDESEAYYGDEPVDTEVY